MPNCFGPPPIFMPEPFSSKSGLTRTATRAGRPSSAAMRVEQADLAHRLDVDQHAGGDRLAQLLGALARPGEADLGRIGAGVERHLQLAGRSHVDAVDLARHEGHQRRHRVGLHRVVQLDGRRQRLPQLGRAGGEQRAVVGVERRAADALGEARQRQAADLQLAAGDRKALHRRMHGQHPAQRFGKVHQSAPAVAAAAGAALGAGPPGGCPACRRAATIALRSILPFGLRGSGPCIISIAAGTM